MRKSYYLLITLLIVIASCNNADQHADHDTTLGNDGSNDGTVCKMKLVWDKQNPSANDSVHFTFTPHWLPSDSIAELEDVHEKKIHFIIVSEDLFYFQHLHLDKDSAGTYSIATTFPAGGKYLLIADYKAKRLEQQADTFSITINGKQNKPVTYPAEQLKTEVNGYSVELLHKKLLAQKPGMIIMKLMKNGQTVSPDSLQPYLGEKTHMIAINTITKDYVHVHSKTDPMSYWFMATFPKAGFYKVWIQFKKNDQLNTIPLVINVE